MKNKIKELQCYYYCTAFAVLLILTTQTRAISHHYSPGTERVMLIRSQLTSLLVTTCEDTKIMPFIMFSYQFPSLKPF